MMDTGLKPLDDNQMAFLQRYRAPVDALFKMADSKAFIALLGKMSLGQVLDAYRRTLRSEHDHEELDEDLTRWDGEGGHAPENEQSEELEDDRKN